jgi:DNA helicase-2/ATP-dependent DNA helicase PcrA
MATGHPEEIEEERRLLYVALTRARDMLYVYFPLRYYHRPRGLEDNHSYAQLTRFLSPDVRRTFDERATGVDVEPTLVESAPEEGAASPEVEAFLSALWS